MGNFFLTYFEPLCLWRCDWMMSILCISSFWIRFLCVFSTSYSYLHVFLPLIIIYLGNHSKRAENMEIPRCLSKERKEENSDTLLFFIIRNNATHPFSDIQFTKFSLEIRFWSLFLKLLTNLFLFHIKKCYERLDFIHGSFPILQTSLSSWAEIPVLHLIAKNMPKITSKMSLGRHKTLNFREFRLKLSSLIKNLKLVETGEKLPGLSSLRFYTTQS